MTFKNYIQLRRKAFNLVGKSSGVQMRYFSPYKGQPYWTHLMNVHNFLVIKGITEYETLLAAILHDVVEDYNVSEKQIAENFGVKVSRIVAVLTKKPDVESDEYFRKILSFEEKSAMEIKIAEKIDNILTSYCYWDKRIHSKKLDAEYEKFLHRMAKVLGWEEDLDSAVNYCRRHRSLKNSELDRFVNNVSKGTKLE